MIINGAVYRYLFSCIFCLDNSAFSEVNRRVDNGFRLYNQFAVFTYSQLQNLFHDSFLGDISDWDGYLEIDLAKPDLPFKSPAEFVLQPDYHALVVSSHLPRPSVFVVQSLAFCKSFCAALLNHEIVKSKLIRGLSSFDYAVMLDGPEKNYLSAIEDLTSHFFSSGWLSSSDKVTVVSQYRSFATKLRSEDEVNRDDWIRFLISHHEMQSRPELLDVFKFACLCLPPVVAEPAKFCVSVPGLLSDVNTFNSVVRSLQLSYVTVPNVSSLYKDPKTICRIFRLLGRGPGLIRDRKFSIWSFLKGNEARRAALYEKMELAYKKSVLQGEGLPLFLDVPTPSASRSPSTSSSSNSGPRLGRVSLAVSRCGGEEAACSSKKVAKKAAKSKKN